VSLFALAAYLGVESVWDLLGRAEPAASVPGVVLAVMPVLAGPSPRLPRCWGRGRRCRRPPDLAVRMAVGGAAGRPGRQRRPAPLSVSTLASSSPLLSAAGQWMAQRGSAGLYLRVNVAAGARDSERSGMCLSQGSCRWNRWSGRREKAEYQCKGRAIAGLARRERTGAGAPRADTVFGPGLTTAVAGGPTPRPLGRQRQASRGTTRKAGGINPPAFPSGASKPSGRRVSAGS
jgi:hypothetical protein